MTNQEYQTKKDQLFAQYKSGKIDFLELMYRLDKLIEKYNPNLDEDRYDTNYYEEN